MKTKIDIVGARPYAMVRKLCHDVKNGDQEAIEAAAKHFAGFSTHDCIIVPIPGHNGTAEYTLKMAEAIIRISMEKKGKSPYLCVADVLECEPHDTLCNMKHSNEDPKGIAIQLKWKNRRLESLMKTFAKNNTKVLLLDNVIDSGHTARTCISFLTKYFDPKDIKLMAIGDTYLSGIDDTYSATVLRHFESNREIEEDITFEGNWNSGVTLVCDKMLDYSRFTIKNLIVVPSKRNKGYGTALLKIAIGRAMYNGMDAVGITLPMDNPLYKKCIELGFQIEETVDDNLQRLIFKTR